MGSAAPNEGRGWGKEWAAHSEKQPTITDGSFRLEEHFISFELIRVRRLQILFNRHFTLFCGRWGKLDCAVTIKIRVYPASRVSRFAREILLAVYRGFWLAESYFYVSQKRLKMFYGLSSQIGYGQIWHEQKIAELKIDLLQRPQHFGSNNVEANVDLKQKLSKLLKNLKWGQSGRDFRLSVMTHQTAIVYRSLIVTEWREFWFITQEQFSLFTRLTSIFIW